MGVGSVWGMKWISFILYWQVLIVWVTLLVQNYPERHAYGLIAELQQELEKLGDYSTMDEANLKMNSKKFMKE